MHINGAAMARHSLILSEDGAMCSRMPFLHLDRFSNDASLVAQVIHFAFKMKVQSLTDIGLWGMPDTSIWTPTITTQDNVRQHNMASLIKSLPDIP